VSNILSVIHTREFTDRNADCLFLPPAQQFVNIIFYEAGRSEKFAVKSIPKCSGLFIPANRIARQFAQENVKLEY